MRISHNIAALNAQGSIQKNAKSGSTASEKLSSGLRINRASDDAAGLSISEKMRGQIRGLQQAARNVQDGTSLTQTAEGGLQEITSMMQRQKELITQGLSGTYTDEDRKIIDAEIRQLTEQIDVLSGATDFNGINLLGNEYEILADRSNTDTVVTITDPPPTTSAMLEVVYASPGTLPEEPRHLLSATDDTDITNGHTNTSTITPLIAPDGREGENEYTVDVHTKTQTDTSRSNYKTQTLSNDPKYKTPAYWYSVGTNDTVFGPRDYGNVYGTLFEKVEVDGTQRPVEYTSRSTRGTDPAWDYVQVPGTQITIRRERALLPDNSMQMTYTLTNRSLTDSSVVSLNNSMNPPTNSVITDVDGNPLPNGSHVIDPVTGSTFGMIGTNADAGIRFDDSLTLLDPSALTINNPSNGQAKLEFDWDMAIPPNSTITLGFNYGPFSLKMDVLERVYDSVTTRHIEQTVTTDITDIDYVLPKVDIQFGEETGQKLMIPLLDVRSQRLGIANMGLTPPSDPDRAMMQVDKALARVSNYRGRYGSLQNRMEHTMNSTGNAVENLIAAESRIRDADMAKEMMNYTKSNIMAQAAQNMLAQANQDSQLVLQLLK